METDACINDTRDSQSFKGITFSKFKKADVRKELIKSVINGKIEPACNWGAEFICAGHYIDLWDIILTIVGKHVHLANPKLPIYLNMRFETFKTIVQSGYTDNELNMRNNNKIRVLFGEIISILCLSNKKHSFSRIEINKKNEFDITSMTNKLKAPNIEFISTIFLKDDPKELFIALNEFAFQITSNNNLLACYWLEWILEFGMICKNKKKELCTCVRRTFVNVDEKFQMDPVWMLWEIIYAEAKKNPNATTFKIIQNLLNLYCIKYTPGVKAKRRYLLYFAISLITEPYNANTEIINADNKVIVENVIKKINAIYRQIKKNEIAPELSYLSVPAPPTDSENTMKKLNKINEFFNK